MAKCLILILLLFSASVKSYSQKLLVQRYTTANGLSSNEVFSIHKDKKGFIWIGTDRGVSMFDGKTFKNYTTNEGLCENTILEIKEDNNGRLWCRGFSGLFTIIENNVAYPAKFNAAIDKLPFRYQFYQFEFDDSSNMYISSKAKAVLNKSKPPYNTLEKVFPVKSDINLLKITSNKFIGSSFGLNIDNKDQKARIEIDQKIKEFKLNNLTINYIWRHTNNSKFVLLSVNKIIHSITQSDMQVKQLTLPFSISSLTPVSDNIFLVGGFDGNLATYDAEKNTYQILDTYTSSISSIHYEDNACWISTLRNGIYYIPNIHYKILHTNEHQLISMLPIASDSLFVLNANSDIGLIKQSTYIQYNDNVNPKTVMYWQRFDNSQKEQIPFVGTYNYLFDRSTKRKVYIDLIKNSHWLQTELIVKCDNAIYGSFYGGLRVYDKKGALVNYLGLKNERITCMFGFNNELYLGTLKGLYKLENNELKPFTTIPFFKNRITALEKIGSDTLVIATQDHGIGIYNVVSNKLSIISAEVGLDKLIIQHISVDDENKIWIATKQSLHLLKLDINKAPQLMDVIDLMLGDLSIKEVRNLNKQVYILVGNQVLQIPEKQLQFNLQPFPIVLTQIIVNGKQKTLNELAEKELNYDENTLLLKYQLISYTQNQQIEYRYQINNGNWVYTSINELQLVELSSAKYKLNIQGRLKNGVWSSLIVINFTIKTPFYKSWWFISLVTIGSLVLLYLFVSLYFRYYYKKRLKEFELKREIESARLTASKSQMNPHFIFNALSSIQNFILKSDKIKAYQYLTDFSSLIRNYLQYSNKDYIKLDKELELLQTYTKIEQLRMPFQFDLQLSKNLNTSEEYIFTLLLQPCIENAIWHGLNHKTGDKNILVTIEKISNRIEIRIADNGIGRVQSAIINANRLSKPASVAISNMYSRIESLKSLYKNNLSVQIIDNYDNCNIATGTTVLIIFDIIYE